MLALSRIGGDFSQAARALTRHPKFFLFATLLLSLGIGMTTALFSLMYGVLLKPLPFPQQDRLVVAWKGDSKDPAYVAELSCPEFRDWQAQSHVFEKLAAMPTTVYGNSLALTGYALSSSGRRPVSSLALGPARIQYPALDGNVPWGPFRCARRAGTVGGGYPLVFPRLRTRVVELVYTLSGTRSSASCWTRQRPPWRNVSCAIQVLLPRWEFTDTSLEILIDT